MARLVGAITVSCLLVFFCSIGGAFQPSQQQQLWHTINASHDDDNHGPNLNFSSPAPHLFHSTASLLQQLPNTIFPNGHTISLVEIPPLTPFYHARRDGHSPSSPEWVAFDSEMSYGIMGGHRDVWMRTYQAARPIRALYFDGESGNLQGLGQFDVQMLLIYGNVTGPVGGGEDDLGLEYARARGLCDWLEEAGLRGGGDDDAARGFAGVEGIVRMNAGFEMIWCDFEREEGLSLVSKVNVTAPQLAPAASPDDDGDGNDNLPSLPPGWKDELRREPFLRTRSWGWFDSATWHYGAFGGAIDGGGAGAGETRAKILSCTVLSFYSRKLAGGPSSLGRAQEERRRLNLTEDGLWIGPGGGGDRDQALVQLRRRRRYHHLGDASEEEARVMKADVEAAARALLVSTGKQPPGCSLADWVLTTREIMRRTSGVLAAAVATLTSGRPSDWGDEHAVRGWLNEARGLSHMFLVNYLQYPEVDEEGDASVWSPGSALFNETYRLCRFRYTALLLQPESGHGGLPEESELRWAVEETLGTICLVQVHVGFAIEQTWRDAVGSSLSHSSSSSAASLRHVRERSASWGRHVSELVAWLGWENEYVGCREVCAADERCYIPMWPITRPGAASSSAADKTRQKRPWIHSDETDLWEPKCVKTVCIEGLCDL